MNNLFQLTKVAFLTNFSVNQKKKNQKKSIGIVLGFGLLFLVLSLFYNYMLAISFAANSTLEIYLTFVLIICAMFTFIFSVMKIQGAFFKTNDYEFLESLPVSKSTIVASKLISLYLFFLFEDLIVGLPAVIFYGVFSGNIIGTIYGLLALLFVSFIPCLVAAIISFIISLLSGKGKASSIINIILYVILFVGVFTISFSVSSSMNNEALAEEFLNGYFMVLPYFRWLYSSLCTGNILKLLYFILVNIGSGIIVTFALAKSYTFMNAFMSNSTKHIQYTGTKAENLSLKKALIKKEWNLISKKPMYFINSYLGIIFSFIVSLILYFTSNGEAGADGEVKEVIGAMIPMMAIMMNSMMTSSAASFNIEGNNFENLKGYPIEPKQYIYAKLKLAILIPVIGNFILSMILAILVDASIYIRILIVISPCLASIFTAIIGMLCALKWSKFTYANEMQSMKNSAAVSFTMLFGTLPGLFIGGFNLGLCLGEQELIGLIFIIVTYSILILIASLILKYRGEKMFYKLDRK